MWNYQQKEHKKYKGSLSTWKITCSFAWFSSSRYVVLHCNQKTILCDVEETTCKQAVLWLCLGFKLPLLTVHMNWIKLGRVAKNRVINKRGVPKTWEYLNSYNVQYIIYNDSSARAVRRNWGAVVVLAKASFIQPITRKKLLPWNQF